MLVKMCFMSLKTLLERGKHLPPAFSPFFSTTMFSKGFFFNSLPSDNNFRQVLIKSTSRRQNVAKKNKICFGNGRRHCGKRRQMLVIRIFSLNPTHPHSQYFQKEKKKEVIHPLLHRYHDHLGGYSYFTAFTSIY